MRFMRSVSIKNTVNGPASQNDFIPWKIAWLLVLSKLACIKTGWFAAQMLSKFSKDI